MIECVNNAGNVAAFTSYTDGRTGSFRENIVRFLLACRPLPPMILNIPGPKHHSIGNRSNRRWKDLLSR